ncbi:LPP20 family lipoprotein [uncultured Psychrosphaera sp.]|jgi:hypothetical protein|uniref:LPP20 family lipoprotein n=1 Tax=uncultured Psychrosphaera sp. TaxID=1403522 RepID=UPI002627BB39|nr:LPP20 family lipoprotein [uncultured Psychrosphaera sp.]
MNFIKSKLVPSVTILFAFILSGCGMLLDKHVAWEYEEPENFPVLRAIGYAPIEAQPGDSIEIKNIMAMRASKLDAYRELTEQVYGQQIQGKSEVKNLVSSDDKLRSKVSGVIRGAKIVKVYPVGGTYATELELDMKLVHELYKVSNRSRTIKRVDYY